MFFLSLKVAFLSRKALFIQHELKKVLSLMCYLLYVNLLMTSFKHDCRRILTFRLAITAF